MSRARFSVDLEGLVQGVGFRPFVHRLAARWALSGFVRNAAAGVHVEVEGELASVEAFLAAVSVGTPPGATVTHVASRAEAPRGDTVFRIVASEAEGAGGLVPPDVATCAECLSDLRDVAGSRHGHAFVTCTACGPRATLVAALPYDRARTTMVGFPLCAACRAEYDAPSDRRFHAESISCPACGPKLRLADAEGTPVFTNHPIDDFAEALLEGKLGALKGVGGFHLVCDATSERAVAELRRRKHRDRKPFAVMVPDVAAAEALGLFGADTRRALESAQSPVVLVPRRAQSAVALARDVAPGVSTLGLLLPYTPVHHLLLARAGGRPLVVTSANVTDAPIAYTDEVAFEELAGIADLFLTHDRPILLPMEDSVVRGTGTRVVPVRRSRGAVPLPVELPEPFAAPVLALGGHWKAVFAFGVDGQAVLGPHYGDLDGVRGLEAWKAGIEHFAGLLRVRPTKLVHDLHPEYASTRYAEERARDDVAIELEAVQHHHAHMASCMAENGLAGDVIGVCFDGTGFGLDGALWGGEFLVGGYADFARGAHLSPVPLPGGDAATRQPWRLAVAHLAAAKLALPRSLVERVEARALARVERLVGGDFCPATTSMGRLFDAMAVLCGVAADTTHEAEAAMALEALATGVPAEPGYPVELRGGRPLVVDVRPLFRSAVLDEARGVPPGLRARRFHSTVVEMVRRTCGALRREWGHERVVLSGGVFVNAILAEEVPRALEADGFQVFSHGVVPPGDGGLALGQLAVAAARARVKAGETSPRHVPERRVH